MKAKGKDSRTDTVPAAIRELIFPIRGRRVIVDSDLARLYVVKTKRL